MFALVQQFIEEIPKLVRELILLVLPLFNPHNRLYWIYTVSALGLALAVYCLGDAKRSSFSLKNAWDYCFPKALYTQRSALLDYQCYAINGLFKIAVSFTAFFSLSQLISNYINQSLSVSFGPAKTQLDETLALKLIYTILAILLLDFTAFFSHYLLHRVPLLWQFHKVHHSAEGLTPMTSFRDHPVDVAFKQTFRASVLGVYMGIFGYFINPDVEAIAITGILISTFLFHFTIHLRHSHIWLSYGWHLNHILCSPAMHQIHHSKKVEHFDKNFALIFSFWDYLFGTIYVPAQGREYFAVGVKERDYDNIWQLYYSPFVQAYKQILGDKNRTDNLKETV